MNVRVWAVALLVSGVVASFPTRSSAETEGKQGVDLGAVRQRASSMPVDARIDMDKRIAATVERVNRKAVEQGSSAMTSRLAVEFSVSSESLMEEKGEQGWSWGDVVVAYTLLANASQGLVPDDLGSLRAEGLSWASIAYGLKFRLEDLEDAIKAQGRVAMGLNHADGKPETIRK